MKNNIDTLALNNGWVGWADTGQKDTEWWRMKNEGCCGGLIFTKKRTRATWSERSLHPCLPLTIAIIKMHRITNKQINKWFNKAYHLSTKAYVCMLSTAYILCMLCMLCMCICGEKRTKCAHSRLLSFFYRGRPCQFFFLCCNVHMWGVAPVLLVWAFFPSEGGRHYSMYEKWARTTKKSTTSDRALHFSFIKPELVPELFEQTNISPLSSWNAPEFIF